MNLLLGGIVGEIVALEYKRGIILTIRSEVLKIEMEPSLFYWEPFPPSPLLPFSPSPLLPFPPSPLPRKFKLC